MNVIGIRHEDKYKMERRVALTPNHVKTLIEDYGIRVLVESSPKRVFTDDEFAAVGAEIVTDLSEAQVIFGVKEMPIDFFEEEKTYIFFSHTIKGQEYNMPLLKRMMEKKINLIEYEKIANDNGQRLIFFGRFAGLAGMINSLWSLGQRWMEMGYETPFAKLQQSHKYDSLEDAIHAISMAGSEILEEGFPKELLPITVGITGYGNVSKGAQEILTLLPIEEISPEELLDLKESGNYNNTTIYTSVFKEKHISRTKDTLAKFELQDYYDHPEKYENNMEQFIPELTVLMNCMYWDPRYPRIITKDFLAELNNSGNMKLTVIGDVTCDPDGSIEATHMGTFIEDPVYVYNPETREPTMGFKGDGILVMAVDILPSELPREASQAFGDALLHFAPTIVSADYHVSFDNLELPSPIKNALILHHGKYTPAFEYMREYMQD
jgi:alpha-aminoadipic semialdehyde synthase